MEPINIPDYKNNISKCKICEKPRSIETVLVDGVCKDCIDSDGKVPSDKRELKETLIVKTYKGSEATATELFNKDSKKMADKGYFPTSQNWIPGSYGCGSFIIALLLCVILIGVLVFIYMIIVKPEGTLSVTYELKKIEEVKEELISEEKECPQCAEFVKKKARVCRFCGYKFEKN